MSSTCKESQLVGQSHDVEANSRRRKQTAPRRRCSDNMDGEAATREELNNSRQERWTENDTALVIVFSEDTDDYSLPPSLEKGK